MNHSLSVCLIGYCRMYDFRGLFIKTLRLLCLTLLNNSLQEASYHVMSTFKHPYREVHMMKNWAFCQQPAPICQLYEWIILELDPPVIVKPSDDCSTWLKHHEKPQNRTLSWVASIFLTHRNWKVINVYCLNQQLGVIVIIIMENWYTHLRT